MTSMLQYVGTVVDILICVGAFIYLSKRNSGEGWLLVIGSVFALIRSFIYASGNYQLMEDYISMEGFYGISLFFYLLFGIGFLLAITRMDRHNPRDYNPLK